MPLNRFGFKGSKAKYQFRLNGWLTGRIEMVDLKSYNHQHHQALFPLANSKEGANTPFLKHKKNRLMPNESYGTHTHIHTMPNKFMENKKKFCRV